VIGFGKELDEGAKRVQRRGDRVSLPSTVDESTRDEFVRLLEPHDLVEFGMIPEFVGRLPVVTTLETLEQHDLVRILTEPRNALVRQYQRIFEMGDAKLEFAPDGLEAIAELAIERKTGVRALRSILEEVLLDLLYELPARKDTREFVVTKEVVTGETSLARGLTADDIEPEESEAETAAVEAEDDEGTAPERETA